MRAKDWKWIFGLSIDEELCWVAARIDPNSQDCSYKSEPSMVVRLADLRDSNAPVALNQVLSKGLNQIKKEAGHVFDGAVSIGVSSIGLVDTSRNRLVSIARKNWIKDKEKDQFIIDFNSLFAPLVGNRKIPIGTQNDATAKCLAEYACQDKNDRVDNLFYAMFSEGVNGGLVYKHAPIATQFHQELGHIYPPRHGADYAFSPSHSGCPVHSFCFEGLASGARVFKQWNTRDLRGLTDNPPRSDRHPWQIIAHYMAHFCWNVVLTSPPDRVLIGGPLVFPEIVHMVVENFTDLNSGAGPDSPRRTKDVAKRRPYIQYDAMSRPGFIRLAKLDGKEGIMGALELARLAFMKNRPSKT